MIHGAAQKQHGRMAVTQTHLRVVRGDPVDEAVDAAISALLRLQRPGGKMLAAGEFLRGFPVAAGTIIPSLPHPPLVSDRPFRR